jgi:hypothetical protein
MPRYCVIGAGAAGISACAAAAAWFPARDARAGASTARPCTVGRPRTHTRSPGNEDLTAWARLTGTELVVDGGFRTR